MLRRTLSRGTVIAVILAIAGIYTASPSSAAWNAEFVYNYHSYSYASSHPGGCRGGLGAFHSATADDKDLANNSFTGCSGDGGGQVVKNNAGSAVNYNNGRVRVYYNSFAVMGCWCGSVYDTFAADTSVGGSGVAKDLNNTYNQNASHHMLP